MSIERFHQGNFPRIPALILLLAILPVWMVACGGVTPSAGGGPQGVTSVSISPSNAALLGGAVHQFNATVTGGTMGGVVWSVNGTAGGSAAVGLIDSGSYQAPKVQQTTTFTITATSTENANVSSSATVTVLSTIPTVNGFGILSEKIVPANSTGLVEYVGDVPTGIANTSVTLSVDGTEGGDATLGTLVPEASPAGYAGYNLPSAGIEAPLDVTLVVTSAGDPALSMFGRLFVVPTPGNWLVFSPGSSNACLSTPPGTQLGVSVWDTVPGDQSGQGVTWSVNGVTGGNSSVGTIAANGSGTAIYTAPAVIPSPDSVTLTATSLSVPTLSASHILTVANPAATVSVSPSSASLALGATQQFSATVNGGTDSSVTWAFMPLQYSNPGVPVPNPVDLLSGNPVLGTFSATGLYAAPRSTPIGAFYVVALSNAGCVVSSPALVAINDYNDPWAY